MIFFHYFIAKKNCYKINFNSFFSSHDVVPHLLRTKPDPEVETRYGTYENRANSLAPDTVSKHLTTLEKVGDLTLKVINREKDDMDLKANQRNEMEKTFSSEETQELVAAITFGKGLRNPMPGKDTCFLN